MASPVAANPFSRPRHWRDLLLVSAACTPLLVGTALAEPKGGNVVGGSATISTSENHNNVTINQFSAKAIINWYSFNIGTGQTTTFVQPTTNSIALNRVTGNRGPSEILGTLEANGKVFLINRDGIIFGKDAVVNTAGFLATTSDIKNKDFMEGRFNFSKPGNPEASIINKGQITAANGGFAALVAPGVRNSGTITANLGTVFLGAGNHFVVNLDFYGDRLITLGVNDEITAHVKDVSTGHTLKSLVTNTGTLKANGGRVELTAVAARSVVDAVINTSGTIEANSVGMKNGQIVLSAATGAGRDAPPQTVKISGTLSAAGKRHGTKGGDITVTGEKIELKGATINASGNAGGGNVMIGTNRREPGRSEHGEWDEHSRIASTVSIDASSTINVSARRHGDGGDVVIRSEDKSSFAGTILALGGKHFGDGGFVDVSSHGTVNVDAGSTINVSARRHGDGGDVIIRSEDKTNFAGTILALGGKHFGDGGFVDVSSHGTVNADAKSTIDVSAGRHGDGGKVIVHSDEKTTFAGTILALGGRHFGDGGFVDVSSHGTVNVDAGSTIDVSAGRRGDGGKVIVRSDEKTSFAGTILALGGKKFGDGGFVEVASHGELQFKSTGSADTRAPHGETGTVLLAAPRFAVLSEEGSRHQSWITNTTLDNLLAANNVTIVAGAHHKGNIDIEAPVSWGSNALTLYAAHNIALDGALTTTTGMLTLGAGRKITATAAVEVDTFRLQHGFWKQNSETLPTFSAIDFRIEGGRFLRAAGGDGTAANPYMIVDVYGLQGIGTLHTGGKSFDLANNIDASGTALWNDGRGFVPIGTAHSPFRGTFDGQGHTISDLTIASTQPGFVNVGLFGVIGKHATVSNLNIDNAVVAATGGLFSVKSVGVLAGWNRGTIANVNVTGTVGLDGNGLAGGLVGLNTGSITNASADVDVLAAGRIAAIGGLVGLNGPHGSITTSQAHGDVTFNDRFASAAVAAGGLVGVNAGTITGSPLKIDGTCGAGATCATGNVLATSLGPHKALSDNIEGSSNDFVQTSLVSVGGLVGWNIQGAITNTFATGTVTASQNGANAGGLVGVFSGGSITGAYATGAVTASGASSNAGGLVAHNAGAITQTFATGAVTGGDDSAVGGLVAFNSGAISKSYATGAATGGANSFVAGLVAKNTSLGTIDQTYAIGLVTGGPGSTTGGLVAKNNFSDAPLLLSERSFGAFAETSGNANPNSNITNSYWNTQTTGQSTSDGGSPLTTADFTSGVVPPGFTPATWVAPTGGYPCFTGLCSPSKPTDPGGDPNAPPVTPPNNPTPDPNPTPPLTPISQPDPGPTLPGLPEKPFTPPNESQVNLAWNLISNILNGPPQTPELFPSLDTPGGNPSGSNGPGGNPDGRPAQGFVPGPGASLLPSGMPPAGEERFASNEVVVQLSSKISTELVMATARELGLELISQHSLKLLGRTVYRFRILSGKAVREIILVFERRFGAHLSAQPSYKFELTQDPVAKDPVAQNPPTQDPPTDATMAGSSKQGDSSQYVVAKLGLVEAHSIATGKGVKIAVIDSEIDAKHPDLQGVVTGIYDALPSSDQRPHPHGTGMAGAIGSHRRLIGIAPNAQILGIRAFGASDAGAQGTSVNIVKGLEWAVEQGAQVINMSFAGPRDPILEQALKALKDRGVILVAAAGNAGPKSPPLFPGADANVIGVSATDLDDKTFKGANRGKQVAIAAPGVDIIVPAPDGGYQLTTGTSVAAAEISGVIALMLERNPRLSPADVRAILSATAKKLPQGRNEVGAGLVDPVQALAKRGPKQAAR